VDLPVHTDLQKGSVPFNADRDRPGAWRRLTECK
jgi:hypothetical protein